MYKLFSVDDHILEPANLWSSRVPAKFRELAPHVVSENNREAWHYNNTKGQPTGLFAVAGKPPEEWNSDPQNYTDMIRGCYDPKERAKDFLSNGVRASVSFPTQCGFGGELFLGFERELASACIEAYNDFILDEWCPSGPPGLYVPTIITKLWDADAAAKEIYRCAQKGAKVLSFLENAMMLGLPSYWTNYWDPVWRACEELDMPICMHIGSGFGAQKTALPHEQPPTVGIALGNIGAQKAMVDFTMSPVCRNFPKLKLVFSEGGIGWIPAALERADRQFTRHAAWTKATGMLPSEVFARNMHFCMIYEPVALKTVRHLVGVERILWELDYPHADTPWPDAQAEVREQMEGIPKDETDAMLWKNAERLFNWKCAELPAEYAKAAE